MIAAVLKEQVLSLGEDPWFERAADYIRRRETDDGALAVRRPIRRDREWLVGDGYVTERYLSTSEVVALLARGPADFRVALRTIGEPVVEFWPEEPVRSVSVPGRRDGRTRARASPRLTAPFYATH